MTARTPRPCRPRRVDECGFTVVEVLVAIALVTIVMTSLAGYFVSTASTTDMEGQRQSAVRVATDAIEKARAQTSVGLQRDRDRTTSQTLWNRGKNSTEFPGVAPYLANLTVAYDDVAAPNAGWTAPLPTDGADMALDGLTFTQNWFLGTCMQNANGDCVPGTGNGLTKYLKVVVAVTWANNACTNRLCVYVTATMVSPTADPDFDASQSAPRPRIVNPGNQSDRTGDTVLLPLSVTGGTAPLSWTPPADLPDGLKWGSTKANCPTSDVCIYGTPKTGTTTPMKITLKVEDAYQFTSTATFRWTVQEPVSITSPTVTSRVNAYKDAVSISPTARGGTAPYSWSVGGLPSGLSINSSTGKITGTLNYGYRWLTTLTVTDAGGDSDSVTFVWYVTGDVKVDMNPDGDRTDKLSTAIAPVQPTASWQYESVSGVSKKWSATYLPAGLSMNTTTGRITGTPTKAGTYVVQVAMTYYYNGTANSVGVNQFVWRIT